MRMWAIESDCCGCPEDIGCIYEACPHYKVIKYYCDRCHDEVNEGELYRFGSEELCAECVLDQLEKVVYEDE